ncbi:multicopper oxidase family protein [Streptomyces sp. YIM 98790]|uniref:multicopper oxidase family protein n=1 Tax=Streptomyces sp. YIM 98790 TaxID=2689077 RepID=UPI00140C0156|nr:multicopper oxidase family protein [Streptomyces sp. YIM 98790]
MRIQRVPRLQRARISRRGVLGAGLGMTGAGLLAACSGSDGSSTGGDARNPGGFVSPDDPEVKAAEAARGSGPLREVRLTAVEGRLGLGGGLSVPTWAYDATLPGPEVRVTAGDTLALTLANHLPDSTSVHWHGLALRNDMDGVPDVTQPPIAAHADFTYRFAVPHPGTYWFHPHTGVQLDRGLYAPLIVEDPDEPLAYDQEWVVVLDDWLDGVEGSTPDAVLAELQKGMSHGGHGADGGSDGGGHGGHGGHGSDSSGDGGTDSGTDGGTDGGPSRVAMGFTSELPSRVAMGFTSELLGGDAGDVAYPHYLVNGRVPEDPQVFRARPGDRIRIRFINAGGDTAFRVALGGHGMTVTHTDGFPVRHAETDALLIAMGERYDVLVTAGDGVFPLTALAEGKDRTALAVLRTASAGATPAPGTRPAELDGRVLTAGELRADPSVALPEAEPDRVIRMELTGGMAAWDWGINGKPHGTDHAPDEDYAVREGERVRLVFTNSTTMWHPMHLHGHTYQLGGGGPRKDTSVVLPGQTVEADFTADNPGWWMVHCHNVYHAESGMMAPLGYLR